MQLNFFNMKNLILTISLFLFTLKSNSQVTTTVPLNTVNYPNGAYLKDLNNELPFWVGTWEGISNNKKYTFIFTLFRQAHINFAGYHYEDIIKGKLKVVDLITNQIIFNNLSVTNFKDYTIDGLVIRDREFYFGFYDNESNCFNTVYFTLVKNPHNLTQIDFKDFSFGEYGGLIDCSYPNQSDIPMYLPRVNLVLTKQ